MIVDIPATTTRAVGKKLIELRESGGAVTIGRVLTLIVASRDGEQAETAIEAANEASREHPCRVIVLIRGDRSADSGLDAQIRVGGDAGASEVVVLRLHGELAEHEHSVVIPFLLPDTPIVVWWPNEAPKIPAQDPLGKLAIRRITDATKSPDPTSTIKSRLDSYSQGDSDLSWSRVTYWRGLLATALDQAPHEKVLDVTVSGLAEEPALDILAGWLAAKLEVPVHRRTGELKVELKRENSAISIVRPQTGKTATLSRTGQPDAEVALARRETRECLAEELRRLDTDEIYELALKGLSKVSYE
ncbi:glucose-6-phosphate dehydrogenase assembly protein OpcA [Rhodococcus sp. BP22]|uniref:glucose-6-phosphate dehydrogenase assembly protein OpcA n=1 Tax=Rhodococcus sp. BP22 TaxID=2758566 RepID=UPI0028F6CAA4|nr:glucose-6-phosphate dehydrogenase assembly protein OpcA [Rhodococcus sp. BP22]